MLTEPKIIKIYCMTNDSRKEFTSKQGNRILVFKPISTVPHPKKVKINSQMTTYFLAKIGNLI